MDREITDEEFRYICHITHVDEIINKKNLRYESIIESNSKNLSGGEKMRIILARSLLKKANIIMLDEVLAEVDSNLEIDIINNIRNYYRDKTIIYISHKNNINNFDGIIDLGDVNGLLQN